MKLPGTNKQKWEKGILNLGIFPRVQVRLLILLILLILLLLSISAAALEGGVSTFSPSSGLTRLHVPTSLTETSGFFFLGRSHPIPSQLSDRGDHLAGGR